MSVVDSPPSVPVPIAAKQALPVARPGSVERSALLARLDATAPGTVITIFAPAGYGKTTLIGQWAARHPRHAYIRVDATDDDPRRLLSLIATAVGRLEPLPEPFLRLLERPGTDIEMGIVAQLVDALWAPGEPFVLVFDDVHELTAMVAVDVLGMIAANLPERIRLVLAGRSQPGLPLARLAVEGRLLRIGVDALALDGAETSRMAEALGHPVGSAAAQAVVARTEGWPAATYLALRGADGPGGPDDPPAIRGDHHDLAAYLRQELLDPLPEADRTWLRRASVMDVLSGPMADAVLDTTGSLARLRSLAQRNLFISPLDPAHTTFKFHQLFREQLRDELDEVEPGAAVMLFRRAAVRSLEDGAVMEAADHALRSGDLDLLARIVERHLVSVFSRGQWATVLRWIEPFDRPGVREERAALAVLAAWATALQNRREAANRWLEAAARSTDTRPMPDGTPDKGPWMAALRAQLLLGGRDGARADAALAAAGMAPTGWFQQLGSLASAVVALLDGDLAGCRRAAEQAIEQALTRGATPALVSTMGLAGAVAIELRDLVAARSVLGPAIVRIEETGFEHLQVSAIAYAAAARLAAISGDRSGAARHLARFDRLRPSLIGVIPWMNVLSRVEAIEAHLVTGDMPAARMLLRETDDLLARLPDLGWLTGEVERLRPRIDKGGAVRGDRWTLTAAELRVLAYLPTHLTAREIADRLTVSPHTIKTQMMSIYGKLGVSSRREAVEQAIDARLLDPAVIYTPPARRS